MKLVGADRTLLTQLLVSYMGPLESINTDVLKSALPTRAILSAEAVGRLQKLIKLRSEYSQRSAWELLRRDTGGMGVRLSLCHTWALAVWRDSGLVRVSGTLSRISNFSGFSTITLNN